MRVTLRAAAPADCELVWLWNFAADARARSIDRTAVALPHHAMWYAQRIASAAVDAPIWIAEADGRPSGVVRIDADGRISIALAADARGHGIGRRAIAAACAAWARPVVAHILDHNVASRACFEACGFVEHARTDALVTYHWSPGP